MLDMLLEPFAYEYMVKAIVLSAAVGGMCAFLSSYLMLKGWSLIGDALSHSVVPGVAVTYALGLPYSAGAFVSGILAALSILWIRAITQLKEDAVIGFIFTTFFAIGLFIVSVNPTAVNVQEIVLGNILGIADEDIFQVAIIIGVCLLFMLLTWKNLLLVFFDEAQAVAVGLSPLRYKILFFCLLSACVVAALQTVGAILVIAMVVTPGATAYLLTDRFGKLVLIAVALGIITCALGAYISFFLDGATGGVIVSLQSLLFLLAFVFAPKYGLLRQKFGAAPQAAEETEPGHVWADQLVCRAARLPFHAECPAHRADCIHYLRAAFLLSGAQRLVADGRRSVARGAARYCAGLRVRHSAANRCIRFRLALLRGRRLPEKQQPSQRRHRDGHRVLRYVCARPRVVY